MTSNISNLDGKRAGRYVGTAQRRIDGRLKVTGGAKYAGEFPAPGLTWDCTWTSIIISKPKVSSRSRKPSLRTT